MRVFTGLLLGAFVGCTPAPKAPDDVNQGLEAPPTSTVPKGEAMAKPPSPENGTSHFVSSKDEQSREVARAVDDAPADSPVSSPPSPDRVAWVRSNCTPQSYPVEECETRCSAGATRIRCESECSTFQAYASCPMVECPDGTDPNWISEYYQATCPRQAREMATDEELRGGFERASQGRR